MRRKRVWYVRINRCVNHPLVFFSRGAGRRGRGASLENLCWALSYIWKEETLITPVCRWDFSSCSRCQKPSVGWGWARPLPLARIQFQTNTYEGDPSPAAPQHNWTRYGLSSFTERGIHNVIEKKYFWRPRSLSCLSMNSQWCFRWKSLKRPGLCSIVTLTRLKWFCNRYYQTVSFWCIFFSK